MFKKENVEQAYITNSEGDTYLLEAREVRGLISLTLGDKFNIVVTKDDAYEIIDSISLVLSGMEGNRL